MASVAGGVAGSIALYSIGIWTDNNVVRTFIRRYGHHFSLKEEGLDKTLALFNRYGAIAVFIGRMMPLVRSAVSLAAGMSRMSFSKFLVYTTISSMLANTFWISIGYILGENWRMILVLVDDLEPIIVPIIIVFAFAGISYLLIKFARRYTTRILNRETPVAQTTES